MCIQDIRIARKTTYNKLSVATSGITPVRLANANAGRLSLTVYVDSSLGFALRIGPLIGGVVYPIGGISSNGGATTIEFVKVGIVLWEDIYVVTQNGSAGTAFAIETVFQENPELSILEGE